VTTRSLTRAAFVSGMLGLSALMATPAFAARNTAAEQYVQENGSAALRTLGDRSVSATQRRQTFNTLMARFADMPRISQFVLGRYGAQLRTDAALRAEWQRTFQDYAIAVYEDRLTSYSGSAIRVTGSTETGNDVIVQSSIVPATGGRALPVQWRLRRNGEVWKVVDVSLVIDGTPVWLAVQQQGEFLAQLDRSRGDIRALMTMVSQQTAAMRQRVLARG
jgi:phospholipid transport system substrate-binding protein